MHENPVDAVSDIVVFMTAYRFQKMAFRGRRLFMGKNHVQKELSSHHIDAVFSENVVVSQLGRLDFKASFDSLMQKTNVVFPNGETKKDSHNDIWTQMEWAFTLKNNMSVLFDADILQPSLFYKLKPFKVVLKDRTFTVHSIAYMLSEGILCTAFSLYDCVKERFITAHDIYGRGNHFHLHKVTKVNYDGDTWDAADNTVSHIISANVCKFNRSVLRMELMKKGYTFYHSMLIMSNDIDDYEKYAHNVIGADILSMPIKNICPTKDSVYFSQECFAIVSAYDAKCFEALLFRYIALESLKLYYFVNIVVAYEQTQSHALAHQQMLRLNILEHMMGVPVLTLATLNNIKQMSSYAKWKTAMDFKLAHLNMQQEERRNNNAILLNLLLYILTLVSTVGTVYDLAHEFCWPIQWTCAGVTFVFIIAGGLWLIREHKKH